MDIVGIGGFEVKQFEQAGEGIRLGRGSPFGVAVDFFKLPVKQTGQFRGFVVGVVQVAVSGMGMRWVRCEGKSSRIALKGLNNSRQDISEKKLEKILNKKKND
ncbi:MAG: hypothetical protein IPM82_24755 [Saprospiraceae bacterium]|nr:hypothetical protein [Saprospiraceae bacterium]